MPGGRGGNLPPKVFLQSSKTPGDIKKKLSDFDVSDSDVIVLDFPLSGKRNYVVEEFSAKQQRAIISWDHYLTT